jgi:hypothetical protein
VSHTRNKPVTRQRLPRPFFPLVIPPSIFAPVHFEYCTPQSGKYLIKRMEIGRHTCAKRRNSRPMAWIGCASVVTTRIVKKIPRSLNHFLKATNGTSDHKTLAKQRKSEVRPQELPPNHATLSQNTNAEDYQNEINTAVENISFLEGCGGTGASGHA